MDEVIAGPRLPKYAKVTILIETEDETHTLTSEEVGFWELKTHYENRPVNAKLTGGTINHPPVLQEIEFAFIPLQQPDGTYFTYD